MFDELPATMPLKSKKRKRAVVLSALIHVALIIFVQMFAPGRLAGVELLTTMYMAPLPPAPPMPPPPASSPKERRVEPSGKSEATATPRILEEPKPVQPAEKPALIQPMTV